MGQNDILMLRGTRYYVLQNILYIYIYRQKKTDRKKKEGGFSHIKSEKTEGQNSTFRGY